MNNYFKSIYEKIFKQYIWTFGFDSYQYQHISTIDYDEISKHEISKKIINDLNLNIEKEEKTPNGYKYSTQLFICNKKEMFEFLYSFEQMTKEDKEKFLKIISSDEEYINKQRLNILNDLFDINI